MRCFSFSLNYFRLVIFPFLFFSFCLVLKLIPSLFIFSIPTFLPINLVSQSSVLLK